jgi:hypothetical protein
VTLDGEETFLQSFMAHSSLLKEEDIQLIKLPASASKLLQPCDVAPSFMNMKQRVKGPSLVDPAILSSRAKYFSDWLVGMDPTSIKTYVDFLIRLPEMLNSCFAQVKIAKSWGMTGFSPFSPATCLARCATWGRMSAEQSDAIAHAHNELAEYMRAHGEVEDEKLQSLVGDAINLKQWTEQQTGLKLDHATPLHEKVINRRRAVWATHPLVLQKYMNKEGHKLEDSADEEDGVL